MTNAKWDVFISHASEDKETFVAPLASALAAFGVRVWYDSFSLSLGDSLSRSIDEGLAQSSFGLVVLSPAFLAKRWTEYELRGLTAREMHGGKVILPIWHNVTVNDVLAFSPPLADKLSIRSQDPSPVQLAVRIIEVVRPDILTTIHRRIAYYRSQATAKTEVVDPSKLRPSPIQHEKLSDELVSRIRLVRAALLGAYTHSMEYWLDGFKRDAHPSTEVAHWEHIAAVYREYLAMAPILSNEQHEALVRLIFGLSAGMPEQQLAQIVEGLPEGAYETVSNLFSYPIPIYDINEPLPFHDPEMTPELAEFFRRIDKEVLPQDLPEELIRQLMNESSK